MVMGSPGDKGPVIEQEFDGIEQVREVIGQYFFIMDAEGRIMWLIDGEAAWDIWRWEASVYNLILN